MLKYTAGSERTNVYIKNKKHKKHKKIREESSSESSSDDDQFKNGDDKEFQTLEKSLKVKTKIC